MPYRDPPPAPQHCEVCGRHAGSARCISCDELTMHLPALEIPVVVVTSDWHVRDARMGIGMVLVDRWHTIARCRCQIPNPGALGLEPIARARAALWAPTARIASSLPEIGDALEDTLQRTRSDEHAAVVACFRAAEELVPRLAQDAREHGRMGTKLLPPADPR